MRSATSSATDAARLAQPDGLPTDVAGFRAAVERGLERARAAVEDWARPSGDSEAHAVLRAFDRLGLSLDGLEGRVSLYTHVHPLAEMRAACEELERRIAAFHTEVGLDRRLYDRLLRMASTRDSLDEAERRLLDHALRDYRQSGVDRSETERARIRALQEELVRTGQDFDRNIVTGGREFRIAEGRAGLAGLPEDYVRAHAERADGSIVLTTDPADRLAYLCYAERDDLRRAYFLAAMNRAVPENLAVLGRLLAQRHELAAALGHPHWADYVTADKMTGSAAHARDFLAGVLERLRVRAAVEYAELLAEKRRRHPGADSVGESERLFLAERVKRARFGFDSQSVRAYFPYASVRDGVLATSAALFGVEFRRDERAPRWHASVEAYEVVAAGEVLARFWLDMHPRDHKFKHAAMFHVSDGLQGEVLPEAALVCNFPEPRPGDPALLLHDQVTTFFHEFGHLLHHLFAGRARFLAFSGISTERDFVEVPSQVYEEWAWDARTLQGFARHHETGAPIPDELVARMRAAEEYGKSLHLLVQVAYALVSLGYYERDPATFDPGAEMVRIKRAILPFLHEEENRFHASFGHLHGYSALYYTYLWSLVIAKDVLGRFGGDLSNAELAREWRRVVLEPGGSRDARELVRDFLGRDDDVAAFERWLAR
jgi:thimet oligopeptidase